MTGKLQASAAKVAARAERYRRRLLALDLVRVTVWVPADAVAKLRDFAQALRGSRD